MDRFSFQPTLHGSGGFAKVIKGRDNALERDIAVKVLDPLVTQFSAEDQERFRREARILAKLSHPNIPAIYDVDFSNGHFMIVFQFIDGQNLREIINESGAVQISTARTWFHQIASALEHAHGLGITHRDIKPENIIITPNRESAYLVDFGIAITAEDGKKLTKSGFVMGTAGYMSPEQQQGNPVDARSDIYSLAITFYETLAGKPLRAGPTYEALSTLNETIPPQIDDMILACLEDRERRLGSAKLFSSQLAGALQLPSKPLSEVLTHGRLHELSISLESLTASDVSRLPVGQRDVLLSRVVDVAGSEDPNLEFPSERFLELMLTRGLFLPKDDYRDIVIPAIEWGFERVFGNRLGKEPVRRALEEASFSSRGEAHQVLMEQFTELLTRVNLDDKPDWYLHIVREVIIALMANPSCTEGSPALKAALRQVNKVQRSHAT
jgi:serine/threonine protein kinase